MQELDYRLDDVIRSMAEKAAQEIVAQIRDKDISALANSQIRKFWDILKMEQSSNSALLLAQHQRQKARKEMQNREEEVQRAQRKNDPRRLSEKQQKLEQAQARQVFWQEIEKIVHDSLFLEQLRSHKTIADVVATQPLISLQILFAESLYSELLYSKATHQKSTPNKRGK